MGGNIERWVVEKPAVSSDKGVVAAQNGRAAEVGAEVLRAGGNAVDAALATAFALAVLEPWMSGLGGGGYMMIYSAAEGRVHLVDFSMVAPRALDPAAYPLTGGGTDSDLFGWPAVEGGRNVHGPLAVAAPGAVAGFALALERFGSLPWKTVLEPAVNLARRGHPVDWWTTLKVAGEAATLRAHGPAAALYLPGGLPPLAQESGPVFLDLGKLADTLERLAAAGPLDFYEGEIAQALAADLTAAGAFLAGEDLAAYRAHIAEPLTVARQGAEIHLPPGLNAGPSFAAALAQLPEIAAGPPDAAAYAGYATALTEAYTERFATIGHDGDTKGQSSTTHLSVIDGAGNMVALTNTLVSLFGAKVLLPGTGVLMNNGIMWFDPRPGRPNSFAPGVRPLCNMCPLAATRDAAPWFALGASGGRRILPAVFQVASFLVDCGLSLDQAMAQPRLNVDGAPKVQADQRLGPEVLAAIAAAEHAVEPVEALVSPNLFANPQIVLAEGAQRRGAVSLRHPVAAAVGA